MQTNSTAIRIPITPPPPHHHHILGLDPHHHHHLTSPQQQPPPPFMLPHHTTHQLIHTTPTHHHHIHHMQQLHHHQQSLPHPTSLPGTPTPPLPSSLTQTTSTNSNSSMQAESPVIHFRQVPSTVTQHDLLTLASKFGSITHFLLVKNHQALIQFASVEQARKFMSAFPQQKCSVRGNEIYFGYSSHQQLNKGKLSVLSNASTGASSMHSSNSTGTSETANHILLVALPFPLTCSQLYQYFSLYGQIYKIVIFTKNGLQALVQFSKVEDAVNARNNIIGKWPSVQFSHLRDLTVRESSERMRDYTASDPTKNLGWLHNEISNGLFASPLPGMSQVVQPMSPLLNGITTMNGSSGVIGSAHSVTPNTAILSVSPSSNVMTSGVDGLLNFGEKSVLLVSNFNENETTLMHLFNLFSCYGYISRLKLFQKQQKRNHALIQMGNYKQANMAINSLKGVRLHNCTLNINFSKHLQIRDPSSTGESGSIADSGEKAFSADKLATLAFINFEKIPIHLNRYSRREKYSISRRVCPPSDTLHVSNFDKEKMSTDRLKILFSKFGNVSAVKIWQYESNGSEDPLISSSAPSSTTNGSSSSPSSTPTEVKVRTMGLVKFDDFEEQKATDMAVRALCQMHNVELDGRRLRVSFSMNKVE